MSYLVRVVAPHFVAGLVVDDDRVTFAAPIIEYMVGWTPDHARSYIAKKGWRASIVTDHQEEEHGQSDLR